MSDSPRKALPRSGFHKDDQHPVGLLQGAIEDADRFEQQRIDFLPIGDRSDVTIEPFVKDGDPDLVVPGKRWFQAFSSIEFSSRGAEEKVQRDGIAEAEASIRVDPTWIQRGFSVDSAGIQRGDPPEVSVTWCRFPIMRPAE